LHYFWEHEEYDQRAPRTPQFFIDWAQSKKHIIPWLDWHQSAVVKPITTNERDSLLLLIAALCKHSKINFEERGAATNLAKMTETHGYTLSDDAIRKALLKIPDAIERRSK
jgi:hypothetical protein